MHDVYFSFAKDIVARRTTVERIWLRLRICAVPTTMLENIINHMAIAQYETGIPVAPIDIPAALAEVPASVMIDLNPKFDLARVIDDARGFSQHVQAHTQSYLKSFLHVREDHMISSELTIEQQTEFAELSLGFFRALAPYPGPKRNKIEQRILENGLFLRGYPAEVIVWLLYPDRYEAAQGEKGEMRREQARLYQRRRNLIDQLHTHPDYDITELHEIFGAFRKGEDITQFLPETFDTPIDIPTYRAPELDEPGPDVTKWLAMILASQGQSVNERELELLQVHMVGGRVMQPEEVAQLAKAFGAIRGAMRRARLMDEETVRQNHQTPDFVRSLSYHPEEAEPLVFSIGRPRRRLPPQSFEQQLAGKDTAMRRDAIELTLRRLAVMMTPELPPKDK